MLSKIYLKLLSNYFLFDIFGLLDYLCAIILQKTYIISLLRSVPSAQMSTRRNGGTEVV